MLVRLYFRIEKVINMNIMDILFIILSLFQELMVYEFLWQLHFCIIEVKFQFFFNFLC